MKSIHLQTPAKINLYLRVLGLRPDKYHEIETLFQTIDLFDDILIRKTSGHTSIQVPNHTELETPANLAMRALAWLENRLGRTLSVNVSIYKRIPIAGGLGGGSSDAAAVLVGLRELYDIDLDDDELAAGALSIGADVPFFLKGGTAVGEGIGEKIASVEFASQYCIILVNPGYPVSTADVYRNYSKGLTGRFAEGRLWKLLADSPGVEDLLCNDLQPVSEALYPEIAEIRKSLEAAGIKKTLMSGSGPTVFGVVEDTPEAVEVERIGEVVRRESWTVLMAKPVPYGVRVC